MKPRTPSFFEEERLTKEHAIDLTAQSLLAYGGEYRHWACGFSGGKDSTATVTLITHLIETGQVPRPETFTVLYADTRMELFPLQYGAEGVLAEMRRRGFRTQIVMPEMDQRFFVYMFGRGVPPPAPHFRWCTGTLKVNPMMAALRELSDRVNPVDLGFPREKFLMLTGVRIGESAVRDQRIALSCSREGSECGQGWYHQTTPAELADTLAPLLHWRVCHIWDWLRFDAPLLGFDTRAVADVYGGEEAEEINARTGCIACNVAKRETSLDNVIRLPQWAYLAPLKRLKPLYAELRKKENRLRKNGEERYADGSMVRNPMRSGPLTMEARQWGMSQVLQIQEEINAAARSQGRPEISLINAEEHARILELIAANTWPDKWTGDEVRGDAWLPLQVMAEGIAQPALLEVA